MEMTMIKYIIRSFIVLIIITNINTLSLASNDIELITSDLHADYILPSNIMKATISAYNIFHIKLNSECQLLDDSPSDRKYKVRICNIDVYSVAIYKEDNNLRIYFFPEEEKQKGLLGGTANVIVDRQGNVIDFRWNK
jgi:hypothetical protein